MERLEREVRRELGRFGPMAGMADLVEAWPAAVGAQIARNAWPARIGRDGTLLVNTSSAAWAFELAQLEATLRERLGELAPRRLRFAVGPLPEPDAPAPNAAAARPPEPSPEDTRRAATLVASLADENLRKVVARAAALGLSRGRSDR